MVGAPRLPHVLRPLLNQRGMFRRIEGANGIAYGRALSKRWFQSLQSSRIPVMEAITGERGDLQGPCPREDKDR